MIHSLNTDRNFLFTSEFSSQPSKSLCFTGHREKSIPPYDNDPSYREMTYFALRLILSRYTDIAIKSGYTDFFSGFAEGVDLWAASEVLNRRKNDNAIKLIGAVPFLRHAQYFSEENIKLLQYVEKNADAVITTCTDANAVFNNFAPQGDPSRQLYRDRNYFMVDNSSAVIAFVNENIKWSGTHQTVNYALKKGIKVCRFGLKDVYALMEHSEFDVERMSEIVFHIGTKL